MSNVDKIVHFGQNCTFRTKLHNQTIWTIYDKIRQRQSGQNCTFRTNWTILSKLDNPDKIGQSGHSYLVLLEKILKRYDKCT